MMIASVVIVPIIVVTIVKKVKSKHLVYKVKNAINKATAPNQCEYCGREYAKNRH